MKTSHKIFQTLSTLNFKCFRHFFLLTSNLSALLTLSILGTFLTCSKPSTTEHENQRPQIEITENITEDTVWESGKDYIVRGIVVVGENATLKIEKDVYVYFDENGEEVKGQIDVQGIINADNNDSTRMIVYQSLISEQQHGLSFHNNYQFSKFKYCSFKNLSHGIQGVNTRIGVENCRFENCHIAITLSKCDSVLISGCEFIDNNDGIQLELSKGVTDSSLKLSYNSFINCENTAIEINNQSLSLITDSIFKNCTIAILCQYFSRANVEYNYFINSKNCVMFQWSSGNINNNQFKNGYIFVSLDSYYDSVNINYNNFEDVQHYNLQICLFREITINAENNWWDTAILDEIEKSILDEADDNSEVEWGTVDFEPYETSIIENCGIREL